MSFSTLNDDVVDFPSHLTVDRGGQVPIWFVIHGTGNAQMHSTIAEANARWLSQRPNLPGKRASAHTCVSDRSIIGCVNRSLGAIGAFGGNQKGLHYELCGSADWSEHEWLEGHTYVSNGLTFVYGPAMFDRAARLLAADSVEFGIPLV
jgi:hypothetical protein